MFFKDIIILFYKNYFRHKKYEIRLNCCDYQVNDNVVLHEIDDGNYTGREISIIIKDIFSEFIDLQKNYIIFSFDIIKELNKNDNVEILFLIMAFIFCCLLN